MNLMCKGRMKLGAGCEPLYSPRKCQGPLEKLCQNLWIMHIEVETP